MSNSAISFNTAGLASTTSPGLVGTGAQTFAGVKTFNSAPVVPDKISGLQQVLVIGPGSGTDYKNGASYTGAIYFPYAVTITKIFWYYVQASQDNTLELVQYAKTGAAAVTLQTYTGTAAGVRNSSANVSISMTTSDYLQVGPASSQNGNQSCCYFTLFYTIQ